MNLLEGPRGPEDSQEEVQNYITPLQKLYEKS